MNANAEKPWKIAPDGLLVTVRATPKGGRDAIDGIETLLNGRCVLKMRVRAAPADGEANDALRRLLARTAGVPASAAAIVQGGTARLKTFRLVGDPAKIAARLEEAAGGKKLKNR